MFREEWYGYGMNVKKNVAGEISERWVIWGT